jgi:hypothetical protein
VHAKSHQRWCSSRAHPLINAKRCRRRGNRRMPSSLALRFRCSKVETQHGMLHHTPDELRAASKDSRFPMNDFWRFNGKFRTV